MLQPQRRRDPNADRETPAERSAGHLHLPGIDIRYRVPNRPQLTVEPIVDERIAPLAGPESVARIGASKPTALLALPLIRSMIGVVRWPQWFATRGIPDNPPTDAFRFDRARKTVGTRALRGGLPAAGSAGC